MNSIIEIKNLSFGYEKGVNVLSNINVAFSKGRIIALLGKNGSGKSTFIDCLLGNNDFSGDILIKGKNIRSYSDKELSKVVSFIPQSVQINIDYLIEEFISFGRNPHLSLMGKLSNQDYEMIIKYAEKCEISHLLKKSINKVSGGERQLAFITRALVQETDIIVMDEPTAALDFGNQQRLFKIMNELVCMGKTIIFTTHNPNHLVNIDCDIFAVKEKCISKVDILNSDVLKEIYGVEFETNCRAFLFKI